MCRLGARQLVLLREPNCSKFVKVIGPSSALVMRVLDFRHIAPSQNQNFSKASMVADIEDISHYSCNNRGRVDKISESVSPTFDIILWQFGSRPPSERSFLYKTKIWGGQLALASPYSKLWGRLSPRDLRPCNLDTPKHTITDLLKVKCVCSRRSGVSSYCSRRINIITLIVIVSAAV